MPSHATPPATRRARRACAARPHGAPPHVCASSGASIASRRTRRLPTCSVSPSTARARPDTVSAGAAHGKSSQHESASAASPRAADAAAGGWLKALGMRGGGRDGALVARGMGTASLAQPRELVSRLCGLIVSGWVETPPAFPASRHKAALRRAGTSSHTTVEGGPRLSRGELWSLRKAEREIDQIFA